MANRTQTQARARTEFWGKLNFGLLSDLVTRPGLTDLAILSDGTVWLDTGTGMQRVNHEPLLRGPEEVRMYAVQLCSQLGARLDDSQPIADASTPDGLRVHAVLAPLVPAGATLSVRFPSREVMSLEGLEASGFLTPPLVQLFRQLIALKATWIVSGATGSGKTTLLKALLTTVDAVERIVSVEETRELAGVQHDNMVSLSVREANVEGAGAVTLSDLVKATVRMRPDRIVLGECRGEEIADLLRAFNTGHQGGFVTIHADSLERLPARLSALGQLAGLSAGAVEALSQGAFDVAVHCSRVGGHRFVSQVGLVGQPLLSVDEKGLTTQCDEWSDFCRHWQLCSQIRDMGQPPHQVLSFPEASGQAQRPSVARQLLRSA